MMLIIFLLALVLQQSLPKPETVVFARQEITPLTTVEEKITVPEENNNQALLEVIAATPRPSPTKKPTPIRPTATKAPVDTAIPKAQTQTVNNDLTQEVNSYRTSNSKPNLQTDGLLCKVAGNRVDELIARGSLDGHAGFNNYTGEIKQHFNAWWETIFYGSNSIPASDIVNTHWNGSSGHKAALLSDATHGCGFVKSGYAVFVLGKK